MRDLVFGEALGSLVFMTRTRAQDLATVQKVISTARTWGDFRKQAPLRILDELRTLIGVQQPSDDEPLEIPGYGDGDWPFPHQEQLRLLPPQVVAMGQFSDTIFNGERLDLPVSRAGEIAATLKSLGYDVERDDDLVKAACGEMSNQAVRCPPRSDDGTR